MIASVRGVVLSIGAETAVVEVGGVGVVLQCSPATLMDLRVGSAVMLPTSLIVREDSLTLYGFADDEQRAVFESVQTVSGIGPRIAAAMLAALTPEQIRRAVATSDIVTLTKVPGIGSKGAQRIVLELKDRLAPPSPSSAPPAPVAPGSWPDQVHAALVGLGWSARDADEAVARVRVDVESGTLEPEVPTLLRAALRSLDRG